MVNLKLTFTLKLSVLFSRGANFDPTLIVINMSDASSYIHIVFVDRLY